MSIRFVGRIAAAAVSALSLAGCVESQTPLITDAKPLLGEQFEVHLYENFVENRASDLHTASYRWRDGQYVRASAHTRDAKRFVARPLEGNDFIIQSGDERTESYYYWIGRKLNPGVYLIFPLDEDDATDAVRKTACTSDELQGVCRVKRYDQLLALARATAAKPARDAALGVVLAK